MSLNVGLLGGGSWGTTVASLTARNANTILWARNEETVKEINEHQTNSKYLPGALLNRNLKASYSVEETVKNADLLVMGIPSQNFRKVLETARPYIRPWIPIVSLSKGLEMGTKKRMTEIIEETLPGHPTGVLTGPNLAKEIHSGQAAAAVIAMVDEVIGKGSRGFSTPGFFGCIPIPMSSVVNWEEP